MQILSEYSPWQTEIAVTSSLLELDLVTRTQMIEHVHDLLLVGYYDDKFLPIIFDDFLVVEDIKVLFRKMLEDYGCKSISIEQARWIYSYLVISNYSAQPENYNVFNNDQFRVYDIFYEFLISGDNAKGVSELKGFIYQLDDAYDNVKRGEVHKGYNDPVKLFALKKEFFRLCQQWLKNHQPKIKCIFNELYA